MDLDQLNNPDFWEEKSTDEKEEKSLELIEYALAEYGKPFVSCSFGKDSLVIVHLVHQINDEIPIVWANTGVCHKSIYEIYQHYKEKWDIIEAKSDVTFWDIVDKYGWPIGARSTGSNKPVSECCKQLKKKPMADASKDFDLEFNGTTAYESWTRNCRIKGDGIYKFVKSRGENGRQVCMPIFWWRAEDVWNYIRKYNIKYPKIYDQETEEFTKTGVKEKVKGVEMDRKCIRVGCWPCPLVLKYSARAMKQLRLFYPKQWEFLMKKKGLADEIAKLKLKGQGDLFEGYFEENEDYWLEKRPCFFDKL
ncbi:MAG: phosphoadenosine phosphosulfate reductase family protein [Bacteroidota bacterium]